MNNFKDLGIKSRLSAFVGDKIKVDRIINNEITVLGYKIEDSKKKPGTKFLTLQIEKSNQRHVVFTGSRNLIDIIEQIPKEKFPFQTTIKKDNEYLEFT